MFERIWLYTRDGRRVTKVTIPHFTPPAEVLLWGSRTFVRRDDGKYYEAMLWPILEAQQGIRPDVEEADDVS